MTSSAGPALVDNPSIAVEPLTTGRVASSRRFSIGSSAIAVIVVGALITAGLAVGAKVLHDANERRLLDQRVREAAAVASSSFVGVQTPLASAAVLAEATDGDSESFRQVMQPIIDAGRPFVSVSIWPTGEDAPHPLVTLGSQPELAAQSPEAVTAFLQRATGASTVVLYDLLDQRERRLGYASVASSQARFVVYAEGSLPRDRRARIEKDSAFAGLDYSLFLGTEPNIDSLLASSTGGARLHGHTESASVPFGDSDLLVVMSAQEELGGLLLARLWWILILLGLTLTIAAAILVERLTHRRRQAEELATENAELYAAQRSVALTLQHSLLTEEFPRLAGVEIGARYVAGVEGIDVGGDWYDVIDVGADRIVVAVGDVSGRGLQAATRMAALRFGVRAYAAQGDGPAAILSKLSELVNVGRDGQFATVFCAEIDLGNHVMRSATAGHPEPLLVDPDGPRFVPGTIGLPVGVRRGADYVEAVHPLPATGTLFFYTDGLIERRGETLTVGMARLSRAAAQPGESLEQALDSILDEAIPDGSVDDTALLGVRWHS